MVVVVGAALAFTSISLKDRQQANADADKMRQILASVRVEVPQNEIAAEYAKLITNAFVVDSEGNKVTDAPDAFAINVAAQSKELADKRLLPVYGAGLWGPIWGYASVDADGSTIYGAYFAHQGETPGLGAEIEKPKFSDQFQGKHLLIDGNFAPIAVVKAGMPAPEGADYVDGVSGGTITSKGVSAMLSDCLTPYEAFLSTLIK